MKKKSFEEAEKVYKVKPVKENLSQNCHEKHGINMVKAAVNCHDHRTTIVTIADKLHQLY
jgi:hypothetical protein